MILTAETAASNGIEFQPSWNESGKECTYDWTISELKQLALEIANRIRPLVSYQQKLETRIKACTTMADLESIVFDFDSIQADTIATSSN